MKKPLLSTSAPDPLRPSVIQAQPRQNEALKPRSSLSGSQPQTHEEFMALARQASEALGRIGQILQKITQAPDS